MGGSCAVNARDGSGYRHDFSTEPRVWDVDPAGPAARALREGDQITSIDGVLITTREGGHGLGLHSSALAAQMMGGRITLESDGPGKGATATLELPLA